MNTNTDSNAKTKEEEEEEEEDSTVTTARRLGILLKPQRRIEIVHHGSTVHRSSNHNQHRLLGCISNHIAVDGTAIL